MLNFSPEKLLLVGVIALLVLGPSRLPQAARTAGRLFVEFRRFSASLQNEVTSALAEPRDALNGVVGDMGLDDIRHSLRNTLDSAVAPIRESINGAVGAVGPTSQPAQGTGPAASAPPALPGAADPQPVPDDPSLN